MAGYRRVNYYELCRLCTSSEGTKMHIFREEGRRRSLPSKIQTCLPLQVQEEDSLPKIICSSCVEKLESYFEFREACINAEAMLESYFTSLKYSDDLSREGKVSVYVKDEVPKKRDDGTSPTIKIPVSAVSTVSTVSTVTPIGETSTILPSAIQILTDPEANRLTQYKVQVQGGIPSLVPFGEQSGLPLSVSIPTITSQPIKPQSNSTNNSARSDDSTQTPCEATPVPPSSSVVAAVIAPPSQDLLQQMGLAAKDRNAITEVIKLKNINILESGSCETVAVSNPQVANQLTNQVSSIIPAQIRFSPTPLNQLISSNIQINMSQVQQNQRETTTVQSKGVNTGKSLIQLTPKQIKTDPNRKTPEVKEVKESKTTVNGNSESVSGKDSANTSDGSKSEDSTKFEPNSVEAESNVEEGTEDNGERNQSNGEDNQWFECDMCSKTFKRKEHLCQHKKSHSGERPFVCTTCTKAFSRKEHLLRHTVSHTGQKLYSCEVCMKSFSRKDNLHKHRRTHGIIGPNVCEICGKSFVLKHYYTIHKAQHENMPNPENVTGVTVKHLTSTNSTVNPLPFKCDLCTKSFSTKQYLTSHRLRHRSKLKQEVVEEPQEQPQQQEQQQPSSEIAIPQPTILTSFPTTAGNLNLTTLNTQLTTINPNAILAPNIIHHSSANVVHIGNASYLCTPNVTSELLEQYKRIQSS